MNCNDIHYHLVDLYEGTIKIDNKADVLKHLEECEKCKKEYKDFSNISNKLKEGFPFKRKETFSPNNTYKFYHQALKDEYPKKRNMFSSNKLSTIAACVVLSVLIVALTPSYAYLKNSILNMLDFALGDDYIINKLEEGKSITVDKSYSEKNISLNVNSLIKEDSKITALFSVDYKGSEDIDDMAIYDIEINGLPVGSQQEFMSGIQFNKSNKKLIGNFSFNKTDISDSNIYFGFNEIGLYKQYQKEIKFDFCKTATNINKKIKFSNSTIKYITIDSVTLLNGEYSLDYTVEFTDRKYIKHSSKMFFINPDGSNVPIKSSTSQSRVASGNIIKITDVYSMNDLDLEKVNLFIKYDEIKSKIQGKWKLKI